MRATAAVLALFLVAGGALAQENDGATNDEQAPDYSRETLLRVFADAEEPDDQPVRFHVGAVEFRALGTRFLFAYVPLMPLPGSVVRTTQQWPDAFSLTGTSLPMTARAWRSQRARNAELRRIERTERARIRVERE